MGLDKYPFIRKANSRGYWIESRAGLPVSDEEYFSGIHELLSMVEGERVSLRFYGPGRRLLRSFIGRIEPYSDGHWIDTGSTPRFVGPVERCLASVRKSVINTSWGKKKFEVIHAEFLG